MAKDVDYANIAALIAFVALVLAFWQHWWLGLLVLLLLCG